MDRLMQHIYDPANAHLFTVESALAAIAKSKAKRAKSILDLEGSLKPAEGPHVQIEDMNA